MVSVSKAVAFIAFVGVALVLGWVALLQATQAEASGQTVAVPAPEVPINSIGYQGVEGGYQNHVENVATTIPEELLPALKGLTFVNGCHPWTTSKLGKCALGTFDSAGWDADESVGHKWSNTIWVSTRAVITGTASDVVLHETGHAFVHNFFDDCYFPGQAEKSVKDLLMTYFAHDQAPPAELLADAFVVAYGKDGSTRHTYYLDKFNYGVSDDALAAVRAAVWLCSQ
ncbi:MAG TPA: hypothetical protein EYG17_00815 [Acidimicrobiia bacterium]|jgi:hypothetical protein|nr:hypothetical protein [Acidimicrobiia bacterium]HIL04574.1 hypothetical protein [Acidimicrobiia bacterium]